MDFDWFTIGGIILIAIGILAYFVGKSGAGGMNAEKAQTFLAIGVILGIVLVLIGAFM